MHRRNYVVGGIAALAAVAMLVGGFVILRANASPELPTYWDAPEFALVNQERDTVRTADLEGTVWVSSFFFTNCTGVCPLITAKMMQVRDSLEADGLLGREVRLISITVDPARDTPDVLRAYARRYGGSPPEKWAFLTGSQPEAIQRMIEEGFRLGATVLPPTPADTISGYQVAHSPRIAVVDRAGRIRGLYSANEPGAVERTLTAARALAE